MTGDSSALRILSASSSGPDSPETVQQGLESFIAHTGADELMITGQIYDHAARLRSLEITADIHSRAPTRIS